MAWNLRLLNKKRGAEVGTQSYVDAGNSSESSVNAPDAFRALGTYHEGLRNRSETAIGALQTLRMTADEIDSIFNEFGDIARQLHDSRKELSELRSTHSFSRKVNDELRERLAVAQSALMKAQVQVEELTAERDGLQRMRSELAELHASDQVSLKENDAQLRLLDAELTAARGLIETLTAKSDNLSSTVASQEKQLHELGEERKLLRSSLEFETAEKTRFAKLHEEVVTSMQAQRRTLASASDELEKVNARALQLEAKRLELASLCDNLQAKLETAEALRDADVKNAEIRLEAVASRARLAEHLLEKTRDEQRSTFRDQAAQTESQRHIRRLEGELEALKLDFQEAGRRIRELENNENQLQVQFDSVSIQLREQKRVNEQNVDKIKSYQEVVEALQKRNADFIEKVEEQEKKVQEQFANERADRIYLEGALNSARRERNYLQNQLIQLKGGMDDLSSPLPFEPDALPEADDTDMASATVTVIDKFRPIRPRPGDRP